MEKEKKFVSKIIADAKEQKLKLENDAKLEVQNLIKEQEKQEREFFNNERKAIKDEYKKILENEKDASFLEQTKLELGAKQQILKDVFNLALQKMKKIPAKDYQKFLKKVLEENADAQDALIISNKKGEKEKFLKLPVFKKKKLKILEESSKISGGAIIVSKICEKDFSFEGLVLDKFQTNVHKISKQLF